MIELSGVELKDKRTIRIPVYSNPLRRLSLNKDKSNIHQIRSKSSERKMRSTVNKVKWKIHGWNGVIVSSTARY